MSHFLSSTDYVKPLWSFRQGSRIQRSPYLAVLVFLFMAAYNLFLIEWRTE